MSEYDIGDYMESVALDLNQEVIKNPAATFYGRVKGWSMKDAGIDDGDLLIIDKSLPYKEGAIAVCFINGEFTMKYIKMLGGEHYLVPANNAFQPIKINEEDDFAVWGIVTNIIK